MKSCEVSMGNLTCILWSNWNPLRMCPVFEGWTHHFDLTAWKAKHGSKRLGSNASTNSDIQNSWRSWKRFRTLQEPPLQPNKHMALLFVGFSPKKKPGFFPVPKCGKPRHILTKVGVSEAIIRCEFGLRIDHPMDGDHVKHGGVPYMDGLFHGKSQSKTGWWLVNVYHNHWWLRI